MDFLSILLSVVLVLVVFLYKYLNRKHGDLEKLGVPIVPTFLCFGSGPFDIFNHHTHKLFQHQHEKYGMTFGKYDGIKPTVVTIDPEFVKSVLTKNSDKFIDVLDMKIPEKFTSVELASGETWKELRKLISPTFTSGKLKGMVEPITELADRLLEKFDEASKSSNYFNVSDLYQCFTISVISKCAFGIEIEDPYNTNDNELLKLGREVFTGWAASNWVDVFFLKLLMLFPGMSSLIFNQLFPAHERMYDIVKNIFDERRKNNIKRNDFVSRLMDMQDSMKNEKNTRLNHDMLPGQGVFFMAAGYETTANTLSTISYMLAKHPEIQDKIYEEIKNVLKENNGVINHETISEMKYLEATINENLRYHGPITAHQRICTEDTEVLPGFVVKKGFQIDMGIYASHHNPKFFPNPEKFCPERFLKENANEIIPHTFRPFGGGPRMCIASRLAMIEVKLALAKIINDFKLVQVRDENLETVKGEAFMLRYPDIHIRVRKR